jgi:hypothetical protein
MRQVSDGVRHDEDETPRVEGGASSRRLRDGLPLILTRRLRDSLPLILILLAAIALQARMFTLVWHYSVNLLYQDQWDYYIPLFDNRPVSDFFLWQIGPVRQGVGFLVYKYVSELSGWDTRVEGMVTSVVVFAALLCALWLKRKLFGSFDYWDLALPMLFLMPALTGNYTAVINPSHGPFPLLLVMLYCLAWCIRGRMKYPTVLIVNFLLIFTTFGIIVGFITPLLITLDCLRAARDKDKRRALQTLLALLVALASLASFFIGYIPNTGVNCFQFLHTRPTEYVWFAAIMFASFLRLARGDTLSLLAGTTLALLTAALCARHAYLLLRERAADRRLSIAVVVLSGFTLVFVACAAFGRVCMGLDEARGTRYVPYIIPAFVALYFHLLTLEKRRPFGRAALAAFLACAALLALAPMSSGKAMLEEVRRGKSEWKRCYIETESVEACDARTNFQVYSPIPPSPLGRRRLDYLKQNRLNLYAGD